MDKCGIIIYNLESGRVEGMSRSCIQFGLDKVIMDDKYQDDSLIDKIFIDINDPQTYAEMSSYKGFSTFIDLFAIPEYASKSYHT